MLIYIIELLIILSLVLFVSSSEYNKYKKLVVFWVFFIALVCGLGDMLGGYDRYIYGEIFDGTADDRARGINLLNTSAFIYADKEKGYALYNYLLTFVTSNRYIFVLITTLLMYVTLFRHITRYSKYPILAFFLLFCIYYFFTFTYFRQIMALCIAWFAIPYAVQRRPIPFFTIIILAATFHNSALLAGGIYFVARSHFTKSQIVIIIVFSLLLGLTPVSTYLFNTLGGVVNEEKTDLSVSAVGGARIAYILEAGFFLYIMLRNYDSIGRNRLSLCMFNIALAFIFVLCFFVRFLDGGRMSWFFLIGIIYTIAEILGKEPKWGKQKLIVITVMVVLYLRVLMLWGMQLSPYKTFLTNGVRQGDDIEERYEYDDYYKNDKFYRPVFGGLPQR